MKEFSRKTIVITKEGCKFLRDYNRTKQGLSKLTDAQFENLWNKVAFKNGGANSKSYPIKENEIRIDDGYCGMSLIEIRAVLKMNGFSFREDGFEQEGFNL